MACDICGKTGTSLNDLLNSYRAPGIHSICPDCERVVNQRVRRHFDAAHRHRVRTVVRFMRSLQAVHIGMRLSWWGRLVRRWFA